MAKRKVKKNVPKAIAHVHATFNNTIVTFTDLEGNALSWSSAGAIGYKGSKKSTPFAAQLAAKAAAESAKDHGVAEASVQVKGAGQGREAAVRSIQAAGIMVTKISDVSAIPHNGCRPPKKKRN